MQTFLPYPNFNESAQVLDRQRLGKQRVEVLQILQAIKFGEYRYKILSGLNSHIWKPCPKEYLTDPPFHSLVQKTPWYNHPAVVQWRNFIESLCIYGLAICNEWIKRGYQDNLANRIISFAPHGIHTGVVEMPQWIGLEKFHSSHRAALLAKNFDYYKQFGWAEKPEINYYWPSKNLETL